MAILAAMLFPLGLVFLKKGYDHSTPLSGTIVVTAINAAVFWIAAVMFSPVNLLLSSAIVFFVGASTVRETYRGWKVDQEIEGLKSQVAQLESQKHSMTELLGVMKTDAYVEQEARLKFNLQNPGEKVLVIPKDGVKNSIKVLVSL